MMLFATRATFNFNSTGADYYKIRVKVNGGSWQVITQLGTATGTPGGSTKTKYFLTADASYGGGLEHGVLTVSFWLVIISVL